MPEDERIVAVGLLTGADLGLLGTTFRRLYKVDETLLFNGLLQALDEADRSYRVRHRGG